MASERSAANENVTPQPASEVRAVEPVGDEATPPLARSVDAAALATARALGPAEEPDRTVWRVLACASAAAAEVSDEALQRLLPSFSAAEISAARARVASTLPAELADDATLLERLAEPSLTFAEAVACGLLDDGAGAGATTALCLSCTSERARTVHRAIERWVNSPLMAPPPPSPPLTAAPQALASRIGDLFLRSEPLNLHALKRRHPDVLADVLAIEPHWGWRRALAAAGVAYGDFEEELDDKVTCLWCGERHGALATHAVKLASKIPSGAKVTAPQTTGTTQPGWPSQVVFAQVRIWMSKQPAPYVCVCAGRQKYDGANEAKSAESADARSYSQACPSVGSHSA